MIAWTGCALLAAILARAMVEGLLKMYPFFYSYIGYVFITSAWALWAFADGSLSYQRFYWVAQFIGLVIGFGVAWELYAQMLAHCPGIRRLARALLVLILAAIVAWSLRGPSIFSASNSAELERNLRTVQAVLLVALIGLVAYYSIPVGRNLRGIAIGYCFFIGTSVLNLSFLSYFGPSFQPWWQRSQPLAYCASLIIWCVTLWSYSPNPVPNDRMQRDYQRFADQTAKSIARLRRYLVDTVTP